MISDRIKDFINSHKDLIETNQWEEIYDELVAGDVSWSQIGSFTEILLDAGIDPFTYMEEIPPYSFYELNIQEYTIPSSVKSIKENAFNSCTKLTSIKMLNNVTSIESGAFAFCTSLPTITIPDSVTSIGNGVFYLCGSLTSIDIPNSVTSIGEDAFEACKSLPTVEIPSSVTSIGDWAFCKCRSLTTVYWNATNCTSAGGGMFSIFYECNKLTTVVIGNNVKTIPSYAFLGCMSLANIEYKGTKKQWTEVSKGDKWNLNVPESCIIHCTDGDIQI